jgi:hypothetical protein
MYNLRPIEESLKIVGISHVDARIKDNQKEIKNAFSRAIELQCQFNELEEFPAYPDGLCLGLSLSASYIFLASKDEKPYHNFLATMNYIHNNPTLIADIKKNNIVMARKLLENKEQGELTLTQTDKHLGMAYLLFSVVNRNHKISEYALTVDEHACTDLTKSRLPQEIIEALYPKNSIQSATSYPCIMTREELEYFLEKQTIILKESALTSNCSFVYATLNHVITILYSHTTKEYHLVDINNLPTLGKRIHEENLAGLLFATLGINLSGNITTKSIAALKFHSILQYAFKENPHHEPRVTETLECSLAHLSAASGNLEVFNPQNAYRATAGGTPISLGILYNQVKVIKAIVEAKIDITQSFKSYKLSLFVTPLMASLLLEHIQIATILLAQDPGGIDKHDKVFGYFIFRMMMERKLKSLVFLLRNGASLTVTDNGKTLLQCAIENDDMESLEVIISNRPECIHPPAGSSLTSSSSSTTLVTLPPLIYAVSQDAKIEIINLLIGKGALLDTKDSEGKTAIDWALPGLTM